MSGLRDMNPKRPLFAYQQTDPIRLERTIDLDRLFETERERERFDRKRNDRSWYEANRTVEPGKGSECLGLLGGEGIGYFRDSCWEKLNLSQAATSPAAQRGEG